MNKVITFLTALFIAGFGQECVYGQTTGSIAGIVLDQNGAVVAGAAVAAKDSGGQEFATIASESGL